MEGGGRKQAKNDNQRYPCIADKCAKAASFFKLNGRRQCHYKINEFNIKKVASTRKKFIIVEDLSGVSTEGGKSQPIAKC